MDKRILLFSLLLIGLITHGTAQDMPITQHPCLTDDDCIQTGYGGRQLRGTCINRFCTWDSTNTCINNGGICIKSSRVDWLKAFFGMRRCPVGYVFDNSLVCASGFKCCVLRQVLVPECTSDKDCGWCGTTCKQKVPGEVCIQVMPPVGVSCICKSNGRCGTIPVYPSPCERAGGYCGTLGCKVGYHVDPQYSCCVGNACPISAVCCMPDNGVTTTTLVSRCTKSESQVTIMDRVFCIPYQLRDSLVNIVKAIGREI